MKAVHMLIGIPGSGKSTYCKEILINKYKNAILVASDKVRDNNPNVKEIDIWPIIYKQCADALNSNKSLIFDATNITPSVRKLFFDKIDELGAKHYEKIAYYFITDVNKCINRVEKRNQNPNERYLPVNIISGYNDRIIAPSKKEGFKEIIVIDNNKNKKIHQINV